MNRSVSLGARLLSALLLSAFAAAAAAACTSVLELQVGDCYNGGGGAEVSTVEKKACTEPHDAEVFANLTHPDAAGAYPGRVAIEFYAEEECINAFDDYVGVAYEDSELFLSYLSPTEDGWNRGDKVVTCVITAEEGQKLTGSMKDSRR